MGLYLAVFLSPDSDDEVDGVEVGSYDDFFALRTVISNRLEGGHWGSRFPVLMTHSDSEGEWSPREARILEMELQTIAAELSRLPIEGLPFPDGSWQAGVAKLLGLRPASLADAFIDVDGEPLLGRIEDLTRVAAERGLPITFQ